MRASFEPYWPKLLAYEGGFSDDPHDPGNWTGGRVGSGRLLGTKYGIAAIAYPNENIPAMTPERAKALYLRDYAAKIRFDDLPVGVDVATLDPAINSGPSRAAKWLQDAVGATADGIVGAETVAAARRRNPAETIRAICARRLGFLRALATFARYGVGWTRRVTDIEAFATRLYLQSSLNADETASRLEAEAANADTKKRNAQNNTVASGTATAGSGAGATVAPDTRTLAIGLAIACAIAVAYFAYRAYVNSLRATSHRASAAAVLSEDSP